VITSIYAVDICTQGCDAEYPPSHIVLVTMFQSTTQKRSDETQMMGKPPPPYEEIWRPIWDNAQYK